jgi:hypothetical protein
MQFKTPTNKPDILKSQTDDEMNDVSIDLNSQDGKDNNRNNSDANLMAYIDSIKDSNNREYEGTSTDVNTNNKSV